MTVRRTQEAFASSLDQYAFPPNSLCILTEPSTFPTANSVLHAVVNTQSWYNGYEFLWTQNAWESMVKVPAAYYNLFDPRSWIASIRNGYTRLIPGNPEADIPSHVIATHIPCACLGQAFKWHTRLVSSHYSNNDALLSAVCRAFMIANNIPERYDDGEFNLDGIVNWNDDPSRTWDDITRGLSNTLALISEDPALYNIHFNPDGSIDEEEMSYLRRYYGTVDLPEALHDGDQSDL